MGRKKGSKNKVQRSLKKTTAPDKTIEPKKTEQKTEPKAVAKTQPKDLYERYLQAVPGDVLETEHLGNGKSRKIVAVDYNTLEKGAIYLTPIRRDADIMNTKFEEKSKSDIPGRTVFIFQDS